jgi:hypothetical protein
MHFSSTPMYKTVVEITHTSNLSLRSVPSRLNHQFLLQINFRTDKRPPTTFPERSKIHCNGHTSVSIVQRSKCCLFAYLQTPSISAAPTKNNSLKISSVKKTIALRAEAPRRRRFPGLLLGNYHKRRVPTSNSAAPLRFSLSPLGDFSFFQAF